MYSHCVSSLKYLSYMAIGHVYFILLSPCYHEIVNTLIIHTYDHRISTTIGRKNRLNHKFQALFPRISSVSLRFCVDIVLSRQV